MIVEIVSHWKMISVAGAFILSAAGATYTYVEAVDERLDDVELGAEQVIEEVQTNRCVIFEFHADGGDPLTCLQD